MIAIVLDTGEVACRHRRSFAGALTITDPAHQTELERQRTRRRGRHDVEVEIRPLARYLLSFSDVESHLSKQYNALAEPRDLARFGWQ